jgi:hypothetical protein
MLMPHDYWKHEGWSLWLGGHDVRVQGLRIVNAEPEEQEEFVHAKLKPAFRPPLQRRLQL